MLPVTVLGAGVFVNLHYVPALLKLQKEGLINVVSVFSRSPDKSAKVAAALDAKSFSGEEMSAAIRAAPSGSAVLVVLPIPMLPQVTLQCIDAGLHVLCEKPVAPDDVTGRDVVARYDRSSTIVGIAENYRHESGAVAASKRARELFPYGPKLVDMKVRMQVDDSSPYVHTPWRAAPQYVGSYLLDGGVHSIALMRLLVGSDIESLDGRVSSSYPMSVPPPDSLAASFTFQNGCIGTLSGINGPIHSSTSGTTVELFGEDGSCLSVSVSADWTFSFSVNGVLQESHPSDGVLQELRAFVGAVDSGTRPVSLDPKEALKDAQFLFQCFQKNE